MNVAAATLVYPQPSFRIDAKLFMKGERSIYSRRNRNVTGSAVKVVIVLKKVFILGILSILSTILFAVYV